MGSREYDAELSYVSQIGKDTSSTRTADETAQALFYKQDVEILLNQRSDRVERPGTDD